MRLAFSFFLTQNFFLFPLGGDSRYFYLLFLARFFFFFCLVPRILVDIRLVYIYIYIFLKINLTDVLGLIVINDPWFIRGFKSFNITLPQLRWLSWDWTLYHKRSSVGLWHCSKFQTNILRNGMSLLISPFSVTD